MLNIIQVIVDRTSEGILDVNLTKLEKAAGSFTYLIPNYRGERSKIVHNINTNSIKQLDRGWTKP